ncbi:MAG: helix-turn-helix transcriptional regulator [Gordonia sp. (in: high G+C Gram-positive bacteria)]|uniref:helix-turn-helix domain-containing protein n=1 Tax=Gordonia sp. (in: high G+C Gram-positive bacteria) TaxID=84139 RepID=UPI0039E66AA1
MTTADGGAQADGNLQTDQTARRKALAAALLARRNELGVPQREIIDRTPDLSRSQLQRLEQAQTTVSVERLWSLALALDTTPSALLQAAEQSLR